MSSNITDQSAAAQGNETIDKGKGKAVQQVTAEETEAETSDDDEIEMGGEEDDDDDLAEIDSSNIIQGGRRTRGKQIDFVAAAKAQPVADEDDEDDEDFAAPEDADKDVDMQ
ncbi:uncharacterized protein H6S33_000207 [Morchella sextelata]|uniref:uncharacterized protein n=1 Tax=Morchella sextelata TaxID=1174677 RepID=UPI001D0427D9|nr:uncharacterized protein H6S33_000207 [Morchella sextelata]KAH0614571.1 hypothetical protein H6S33_000207 [Morchella sextelata]